MRILPLLNRDMNEAVDLYLEGVPMSCRTVIGDLHYDVAVAALRSPDSVWWVVVDDSDAVIGLGGFERLNWIDGTGEPYIAVVEGHRKTGLGLKLAKFMLNTGINVLKIRRIQTIVLDISPSLPLLQKIGFKHEGTLRQIRKHEGKWVDAHMYAFVNE